MLTQTKISRLVNSFVNILPNRKGNCTPDVCQTLNGQKKSACCKLDFRCPVLFNSTCGMYKIRPRNCRVFPANENDLTLVRHCGYHW